MRKIDPGIFRDCHFFLADLLLAYVENIELTLLIMPPPPLYLIKGVMNSEHEETLPLINYDVCINGKQAADMISVVQVLLNIK